ncbi:MAG TPA: non-ribosomal peptide synthetase [Candidatus Cybelea sp.]|nr:non-ribosomal peptide synthetase [Candidatus Cybelea sp.]
MRSDDYSAATRDEIRAALAGLPERVRAGNQTATEYPRDKTVAQVFEEVAAAHPGSVALEMGETQVTYAELDRRANSLARGLRAMGVGGETLVGCCVERSIQMIVAFLGVLKAGGAYVPFDLSYPEERSAFMVEDTRASVILLGATPGTDLRANASRKLVRVDDLEARPGRPEAHPPAASGPRALAYVMYTSGSTGRPKGVMVENRSIVRLVRNTHYCRFGPEEVFLQFAPVSFDAATFEIWGPLLNGGKLVIMPPVKPSLERLGREIRTHGVTTLWLTSGLFNVMVEQRLEDLGSVRQLLAGGDVLSPKHVRMALRALPDCRVINGYGPTENTTFTCCYTLQPGDLVPEPIPIGGPIANTQVYILDEQMKLAGPGETGELYAAGDGVARGYWNDPEGTSEKFLPNPYSTEPHGRMYRTGDLARWREDGVLEFLGRRDTQVKVLGHRIEPGEVEAVLGMNRDVNQVCVVVDAGRNGSKRLVAYYVSSATPAVSPSGLRQYLAGKLPHYMIPALFVPLAELPLSANGKVDRAALPAQPRPIEAVSPDRRATELETALLNLWKRILRVDAVGLDDNFFDLGGDSLMIIAMHSNLQKSLGREIEVTDLFEFPTIRTLARRLEQPETAGHSFRNVERQAEKRREAFEREKQERAHGPR